MTNTLTFKTGADRVIEIHPDSQETELSRHREYKAAMAEYQRLKAAHPDRRFTMAYTVSFG